MYEVPAGLIKFCSTVVTPQNVVFSVKFPPEPDLKPGGRYLVLDAVRDPGNIGTILRAADAFGTDAVIITDDCVDIYSPKTVRSTMGAIFRQAVRIIPRSCAAEKLSSLRVPVYGASAENGAADIADIDLSRCAVVRNRQTGFQTKSEHLLRFSENTDERQGGVAERLRRRRDNCIFDEQSKINRLFVFSVYAAAYTGWLKPPY